MPVICKIRLNVKTDHTQKSLRSADRSLHAEWIII